MRKPMLVMALSACAATVVGRPAADAAEAAADTVPAITLKALEVSANRATARTPVAVSTVSKEQLDRSGDGRDLPYLLSMTPSVVVTSDAGAGVGYSGLRVRGSDATRINVMTNGVPLNDPESHAVYWVNLPDLASSLRDVQIQRGAGTSANGTGAFGASVNMVTDAPSQEAYARLSGAYGSYGTHRESLRAGTGLLGDRWSIDMRLSNIGSDGYIRRASSDLWGYTGQVAYSWHGTNLRLLAFGGKEISYMAWDYASKEQMERYGRRYNPCGEYTDKDGNTAYYPDQKDYFTQHHLQLHLSQRLGGAWHLAAAAYYTRGDGYYEQYKTGRKLVEYGLQPYTDAQGATVNKSDLVRLKFNDNHFGGLNATLGYSAGRVEATLGASASYFSGAHYGQVQWVRNYQGPIDPLQQYYRNTGTKWDENVYARANVRLTSSLSAYADMQYRHIDYEITGITDNWDYNTSSPATVDVHRRYNFFNPKAGIDWNDGRHNRAFASWSVAHREPVRDNFTDGDRAHDPRPERLMDYEAGYTWASAQLSLGLNLYYMDYKDQLVLTGQLSDTGNPLSVNVPKSYRMGIELQGAWRPCTWCDWQLSATLSRNRIHNFTEYIYEEEWTNPIAIAMGSTPIAFSPGLTAANAFNFHWRGLDASLLTRYVGKQYLTNARNDSQALEAYCVSDLELAYDFGPVCASKGLRLGFTVHNIFNEKYFSNGYAGAGYTVGADGSKDIYRYSGYAAQAPVNVMGTVAINF